MFNQKIKWFTCQDRFSNKKHQVCHRFKLVVFDLPQEGDSFMITHWLLLVVYSMFGRLLLLKRSIYSVVH